MGNLIAIPNKPNTPSYTAQILPIKLSWEERKTTRFCPVKGYFVSSWSCWQCPYWEVHSQLVSDVTKQSGHCLAKLVRDYSKKIGYRVVVRKASKQSRKLTALVALKASGVAAVEDTIEKRREQRSLSHKVCREGGQSDKKDFVRSFLLQTPNKESLRKALIERYPTISDAYINTLYYAVKKDVPGLRSCKERRSSKSGGLFEKRTFAERLFVNCPSLSKEFFKKALQEKFFGMSDAYCIALFYQVRPKKMVRKEDLYEDE